MKAVSFGYVRPSTVDDVVADLTASAGEGKVLAGGQSLVPVMAMRLARPPLLVDINVVAGLDELSLAGSALNIGATVRQRQVEGDERTASVPLLGMALPWVGHRELRSRGTVCGSLAHADPAAELPAVAACLDAALEVAGPSGRRVLSARDFFIGAMTTQLGPDDVLVRASFPVAAPGEGFGFAEFARRHGDFALAGVAVRVRRSPREAVLVAFGVSDRPVVRDVTELLDISEDTLAGALHVLAAEMVDTVGDMHASVGYRRRLVAALAAQELARAWTQALHDGGDQTGARLGYGLPGPPARGGLPMTAGNAPAARVRAGELAETRLTVNGSPVVLRLPARVTLADALREHLALTGTHLGCEHGVCGMCTVLVDGAAARACLLFACQLENADVVTVEGLGRPSDLHPLQEAFGRHHALQCGFCTPGFLLSAYDLLAHKPGVTAGELPAELSGVLCRCTGYRNILDAVSEVAEAYRDGLPEPHNCGPDTVPGGSAASATAAYTGADRLEARRAAGARPRTSEPPDIGVPQGAPTFVVQVTSELPTPVQDVWRVLADVHAVARCLPGAELTEDLGGDRYGGTARIAVGPVRLSFAGLVQVAQRDEQARRMRLLAQGQDAAGSRTQADIWLTAETSGTGCQLTAEARVYLTGRIAQFGRALAGDVSRRLFEQFAVAVGQAASDDTARSAPSPPGTLRLVAGVLADRLRALARRLPGRRAKR
ncbi:MAG: FAD binding domain-containing protein [Streptosporangiaceae bacterium]